MVPKLEILKPEILKPETGLKEDVDERASGGLGQQNQSTQQNQDYHDRRQPPFAVGPEGSIRFQLHDLQGRLLVGPNVDIEKLLTMEEVLGLDLNRGPCP